MSKYTDGITELAGVRVRDHKIVDEFQTLVNPQRHIPSFITRLTGIDDDMVKDAPKIRDALPEFLDFIGPSTIIAHNATFDFGFINQHAKSHCDIVWENDRLCTRKLANRMLPDLPSKRLDCVCSHFDIINTQAHRAMADVVATKHVFSKMLSMLSNADVRTKEDIFRFESSPIRKCQRILNKEDSC
ncbi:hypothetical protein KY362_01510 [Candidatus Woesearchaeota archaeon]|nr:hypothetical protein [Candidatus Woesearchaeota archaeon]